MRVKCATFQHINMSVGELSTKDIRKQITLPFVLLSVGTRGQGKLKKYFALVTDFSHLSGANIPPEFNRDQNIGDERVAVENLFCIYYWADGVSWKQFSLQFHTVNNGSTASYLSKTRCLLCLITFTFSAGAFGYEGQGFRSIFLDENRFGPYCEDFMGLARRMGSVNRKLVTGPLSEYILILEHFMREKRVEADLEQREVHEQVKKKAKKDGLELQQELSDWESGSDSEAPARNMEIAKQAMYSYEDYDSPEALEEEIEVDDGTVNRLQDIITNPLLQGETFRVRGKVSYIDREVLVVYKSLKKNAKGQLVDCCVFPLLVTLEVCSDPSRTLTVEIPPATALRFFRTSLELLLEKDTVRQVNLRLQRFINHVDLLDVTIRRVFRQAIDEKARVLKWVYDDPKVDTDFLIR